MNFIKEKLKISGGEVTLALSILILAVTVALPIFMIFYNAFFVDGHFTLDALLGILKERYTYEAWLNTIKIAILTTFFGTIIGVFFAWLVGRTDMSFKGVMKILFLVPYMFPPFIGAMAWGLLLSPRAGYLNKFYMSVTESGAGFFDVNSIAGIVFVESLYFYPFVFITVSGALERMDPTLEESARIAGAGLFEVMRKITLPLVFPSIIAGSLLILISSLSHFGVPAILGLEKGIFTIPVKIYERIYQTSGSFEGIRAGTVLSVVLVFTVGIALYLQRLALRKRKYEIIAGKSMRPMLVNLRGLRVPLLVLCIIFLLITVAMPTAIIFLVALVKAYGLPFIYENLTLNNFKYVLFGWKMTQDAIRNSIILSVSAAIITMFAGTMIAYVVVKSKAKGKGMLELLSVLPFSIPGTVLAIGVILSWSGLFILNLYNTLWIILIAYIARYMAFSMKSSSASLEQIHSSLEEAARACGATYWGTLKDIIVPLVRPGMLAGFFLIFLPSVRELTVSILLYGPYTRTIGVSIYALKEDGYPVYASAMAAIALAIILIGQLIVRRIMREKRV